MRYVETSAFTPLAAGGAAVGLGLAASALGDPRLGVLAGGTAFLAGTLRHPLLGVVFLGVLSPLIPVGFADVRLLPVYDGFCVIEGRRD